MEAVDRTLGQNLQILAQVVCDVCQQNTLDDACREPLSRNQLCILRILAAAGSFPVNGISQAVGISNAAASKNVDRLERLGFVRRWTRQDDRRCHEVEVLPAGRAVVQIYQRISAEKQAEMFRAFSPAEKHALLGFLKRLLSASLAEERNTEIVCLQCDGTRQDVCFLREIQGGCVRDGSPETISRTATGIDPSSGAGSQ